MSLRAKMALAALFGIFFIPLATSDLRGLTHVLTCEDAVSTSLTINDSEADEIVLGSANVVTAEGEAETEGVETYGLGLCGGLLVDLQVPAARDGRADVVVAITNTTEHDWQGTIDLRFDDTPVPLSIGSIDAGDTETDTVELRIDAGADYEVTGTLLIGP